MKTNTHKRKTSPVKVNYLVDLTIFAAFLITFDPHSTGLALHEWLGIAFGAAAVVHLLLHWKWLVATTRRFLGKLTRQSRLNYVLNGLLFAAMTLLIFSGLMISEEALPVLGLRLSEGVAWRSLHFQSADAAIILLGFHVALHWKWIAGTTRRYVIGPIVSRIPKHRPEAALSPVVEMVTDEAPA